MAEDTTDVAHPNLVGQDKVANLVYEKTNQLMCE
jgi:hypothetical protein